MKKIKADFHKKMESTVPKTKTITVDVEGESYEIEIKNILSAKERIAFLEDTIKLITADFGFPLTEEAGGTLVLMQIIASLTDIEFPEDIQEKIEQFNWLLDTGIVKAVEKALRPGMITEMADFLTLSMDQLQVINQERLDKVVEGTELPQ